MPFPDGHRVGDPPAAEPIAIVGMGCRFPGGNDDPSTFWTYLSEGRHGIGSVPEQRWAHYAALGPEHAAVLRRITSFGGFLDDVEGFDAAFFRLSSREAELMDPQQRILLEVAWEALEHAGIPPLGLAGSDAGVFVGVGSDDYGRRLLEDLPRIEAWTGIGASMCAAANRISYALDLRGPSMAVDTACSASLVALHLACTSLRQRETDLALAAGVNLLVAPGLTATLEAAGAMAPDGRCKAFDAAADGYGRGEGCGVLVLKRLEDALTAKDLVIAVVRGSAVNQDGRTNGIMAPSSTAQEYVVGRACRSAGVAPQTIDYVEAHGTGTRMGDPTEAAALAAVLGRDRVEPCLIGSVKSNIGHLEAGAGVAGVIKAALALAAGEIPPSLHVTEPNPAIGWDGVGLRVVTERTPWPRRDHPRRAGVSGFGYGGTIAHAILEEAPAAPADAAPLSRPDSAGRPARAPTVFPLSGASEAQVRAGAGRLAAWLEEQGAQASLAAVGHTLAHRRSHLSHRAAVVAGDRDELLTGLRAVERGEETPGTATGALLPDTAAGVLWVFSGHGSQWAGMGRGLLSEGPFAAVVERLDPIFAEELRVGLRKLLENEDLGGVHLIQPLIFGVQVGLAATWRAYGVTCSAVVGHSVGEIAAAVAAGVLDLEDGARLVCRRSLLLRRVAGRGAMAMVDLAFAELAERLADDGPVVAAVSASPTSTVVAGDASRVAAMAEDWRRQGRMVLDVASDVAFHSSHMDELVGDLRAALADIAPRPAMLPLYTTALDDPRSDRPRDAEYWAVNLRRPVRFAEAIAAAVDDGYRVVLEVSPHPVLVHSVSESLRARDLEAASLALGTLRRDTPERQTMLSSLARLHCHGVTVDWDALQPATGQLVDLPRMAWQRRRLWAEPPAAASGVRQHDPEAHTLLGGSTTVAGTSPLRVWRTSLDAESRPYPGRHPVQGTEIVPGAVLLLTFLEASPFGVAHGRLTDVRLRTPLGVAERRAVQVVEQGGSLRLASRPAGEETDGHEDEGAWLVHATASAEPAERFGEVPAPLTGSVSLDPGEVRASLSAVGIDDVAFDWRVVEITRGEGTIHAWVEAGGDGDGRVPTWAGMLDAVLSIAPMVLPGPAELRLFAGADRVQLGAVVPARALVSVAAGPDTAHGARAVVSDDGGTVLGLLEGLRFVAPHGTPNTPVPPEAIVHEICWRELTPSEGTWTPAAVAVVGGEASEFQRSLRAALADAGADVFEVGEAAQLAELVARGRHLDVTVVLPPGGEPGWPLGDAAVEAAWRLGRTVQALAATAGGQLPRVWAVTAGVGESEEAAHLVGAPLWGLGRVAATEHPDLWGGVVDVDPGRATDMAAAVLLALGAGAGEGVVVVRDGRLLVPRLVPVTRPQDSAPLRCRPDGTYLVTGGLGGLGLEVARWLAERGARRLLLASRRGLPPRRHWDDLDDPAMRRAVEAVRGLEAMGVTVSAVALDVANRAEVLRALDTDALGLPPVRGVVHAAGVLDDRLLAQVDKASLRTVMRPKVDGALVLHERYPPGTLDFFVLFSSCGLLLGLTGQSSYASANAFMDALARHRRAAGCRGAASYGWTSWRGMGMAASAAAGVVAVELEARGVGDLTAAEALRAWERASGFDLPYAAMLRTVPLGGRSPLPLFAELPFERPDGDAERSDGYAGLSPEERRDRVLLHVGQEVAAEMKLPLAEIDPRRPLADMGLDSVMSLTIRRRLERRFALDLPATLLWLRPSVGALADHVGELLTTREQQPV